MSLFESLLNIMGIFYIAALVLVLFSPNKRRERIKQCLLLIMLYPPIFAHNNFAKGMDINDDLMLVFFVFIIHSTIFVTLLAWILKNEEKQQKKYM
ncbi:hypothetical protein [Bacillus halotolerans]|uniref:hypothetical protein n=1 Tax=Bacillus halotolerans TaxID=260554 RepID=UPI004049F73B